MAITQELMKSSAETSPNSGPWVAALLAMIAGYVDAYGFISYGAYMSFMSGNTTQSGIATGEGNFSGAIPTLTAIAMFVVGVFAGTLFTNPDTLRSRRLKFALVAALLAVNIGTTQLASFSHLANIATLSFAMGVMNTTLSHLGAEAVNLTFVTGTLNKIGSHLALALKRTPLKDAQRPSDTHLRRAFLLAALWAAFLVGAVLAAAATARFGVWVLLVPLLVLVALAAGRPFNG
ncbi:MAG TPA: YoaK family protein [Pirellulales bacterium]|nr:YoaK family protein [Pirellulales bacterium]